jgi:hypothetical protein
MGGMSATSRNNLTAILARIDQLLADAEALADGAEDDDDRDRMLNVLIEFQEMRQKVEARLMGE